jgi:hypothetical protein
VISEVVVCGRHAGRLEHVLFFVHQPRGRRPGAPGATSDRGTDRSAATFLRLKWQFNAGKVHSAEEFIREIATRSGTSGLTYHVKLADGSQQESAEFLHGLLSGIPGT